MSIAAIEMQKLLRFCSQYSIAAHSILTFLLILFIVGVNTEISSSLIGLLGVLVGGLISTFSNLILAERQQLSQISAVIIQKRLQAHQEAFSLWRKIVSVVHNPEHRSSALAEAQFWWDRNCIFLSDDSRSAFIDMLHAASAHYDLVQVRTRENIPAINQNWDRITRVGSILIDDAGGHVPDRFLKILTEPEKGSTS